MVGIAQSCLGGQQVQEEPAANPGRGGRSWLTASNVAAGREVVFGKMTTVPLCFQVFICLL